MTPLPLVAVAGSPNAGKSALFNALTGARQKVGNYPGVTVERHSGRLTLADGRPVELVDLPGAYSLDPAEPGRSGHARCAARRQKGERQPDALVIVVDASNLDNHLRFALQLIELGLPTIVALNMVDLAKRDGLELDPKRLEAELGVPVVETVAVRKRGIPELQAALDECCPRPFAPSPSACRPTSSICSVERAKSPRRRSSAKARSGAGRTGSTASRSIRSLGPLILAAVLFVMFQAVFAWSEVPVGLIESGMALLGQARANCFPKACCAP